MKYLGFTSKAIDWCGVYFKKQNIVASLEKTLSETGIFNFHVTQGSILDFIVFLFYVKDMKTALKNCFTQMIHVYFIAAKMSSSLKWILNYNFKYKFTNLCQWFINNKLSIHFGEHKTKSILFKRRNKSNFSLNITQNENVIKQQSMVEYLGSLLDEDMSVYR